MRRYAHDHEKGDPEEHLRPSPARVRFVLSPGQITGLDSEEGRSLNLTCGADVKTLSVDVGERDRLAALQARAPRRWLSRHSGMSTATDTTLLRLRPFALLVPRLPSARPCAD